MNESKQIYSPNTTPAFTCLPILPLILKQPRPGHGTPSVAAFPAVLFGSGQVKETDLRKTQESFFSTYRPAF